MTNKIIPFPEAKVSGESDLGICSGECIRQGHENAYEAARRIDEEKKILLSKKGEIVAEIKRREKTFIAQTETEEDFRNLINSEGNPLERAMLKEFDRIATWNHYYEKTSNRAFANWKEDYRTLIYTGKIFGVESIRLCFSTTFHSDTEQAYPKGQFGDRKVTDLDLGHHNSTLNVIPSEENPPLAGYEIRGNGEIRKEGRFGSFSSASFFKQADYETRVAEFLKGVIDSARKVEERK